MGRSPNSNSTFRRTGPPSRRSSTSLYQQPAARITLNGRGWELKEIRLEDLLHVVDETEEFIKTSKA